MSRLVQLASAPTATDPRTKLTFLLPGYVLVGPSIYDVDPDIVLGKDATLLSEDATDRDGAKVSRYVSLPAEHKGKVLVCDVYRSKDTSDLKSRTLAFVDVTKLEANAEKEETVKEATISDIRGEAVAGKELQAFAIDDKETSATPEERLAVALVEKVKERLADKSETNAVRVRVSMDKLSISDIPEATAVIPHQWLGE